MLVLVGADGEATAVADRARSSFSPRVFLVSRARHGARRRFLLSALNVRYRDVPYAIPVFLAGACLCCPGVPYAVNEIPEKWQWILLDQSDHDRHRRLALGDHRRTSAQPGPVGGRRRRRDRASARRPRVLPSLRAAVRRHDLMAVCDLSRGAVEALPHRRAAGGLRNVARIAGPHAHDDSPGDCTSTSPRGDLGAARRLVRGAGRAGASESSVATARASRPC